jgi:hypothetical protein
LRETGLIQRTKEGFTFVHRSLWEYFTALALLENSELVMRNAANPGWEEVIRLYAGLLKDYNKESELINNLWKINRPLALRVTTETRTSAKDLIKPLLEREESNQARLLLIESLEQSLPLISRNEWQKLVHETFSVLFFECEEHDYEVIFHAQELLDKLNLHPLEPGGLIYKFLDLQHAAKRQQNFLNASQNYFEWIEVEGGT